MEENSKLTYPQYKEAEVTFTQEVMHSLALKSKETVLICGVYRLPAMVQKASFEQIIVIVPGLSFIQRIFDSQEDRTLNVRLSRREASGKFSFLELKGHLQSIEGHHEDANCAIVKMMLDDEGQAMMASLLGGFIHHVQVAHEQSDKWFKITASSRKMSRLSRRHCTVSMDNGEKRRCFVQALSMEGALFLVHLQLGVTKDQEVSLNLIWGGHHTTTSLIGVVEMTRDWELSHGLTQVKIRYKADQTSVYYHDIIGKMIDDQTEQYED